jgi:hypothetical protein
MIISARAKHYRDKAVECGWMASRAKDLAVKASLADLAAQWRHLADQAEQLEQERANRAPLPK